MNVKLKASVVCGVAIVTLSSVAQAQSSTTLYGILDEAVMYQNNTGGTSGGKRVFLDSVGGITGSRWGLKGSEDLGGGLNAIFTLESGLNINNGTFAQGGTAFGRQIFVGLSSDRFGSLTFGRQYDMVYYFPEARTLPGYVGSAVFTHPGDLDNAGNSVRVNNAIRYMSAQYSGFSFGSEYSVGGVAGNTTANSGYSVGAGYINGPVSLGAAFEYFKNPTSTTAGSGLFTNNANGASQLSQSLNRGYASASAYQVVVIGGTYVIGPVTLIASGSNIQYANLGAGFAGGTARFNNGEVGASYKFSPSLFFSLGYDYLLGKGVKTSNGTTVGNQHYHQVMVMGDYLLSKRTDVYIGAGWQRASGTSSTGKLAVADFTNYGDSSNNHQILIRAAFRHKF